MTKVRAGFVSVALVICTLLITPAGASRLGGSDATANGALRSTLGAGYLQSPSVGVNLAQTEFRVPSITCAHANDVEQLWLGLQEFEGTAASGFADLFAQVLAECVNGRIDYSARANTPGGSAISTPVSPGDVIDAAISDSSSFTEVVVSLASVHGNPDILDQVGDAPSSSTGYEQSVLIGQQDLTAVVPTFFDAKTATNRIDFLSNPKKGFGSRVNDKPLASDGYPLTRLSQANNHVEISTSALNASSNFQLSFHANF